MDKKGFELTISTLVIFIIGISVLIGLILFLNEGFEDLESGTAPLLETTEGIVIREACELSCFAEDKISYCCNEFDYKDEKIFCKDARLELECEFEFDCEEFVCG